MVNITSWAVLPARDEKALEAAVATIGPIAASVNASPKTFQLYQWVFFYSLLLFGNFEQRKGKFESINEYIYYKYVYSQEEVIPW